MKISINAGHIAHWHLMFNIIKYGELSLAEKTLDKFIKMRHILKQCDILDKETNLFIEMLDWLSDYHGIKIQGSSEDCGFNTRCNHRLIQQAI